MTETDAVPRKLYLFQLSAATVPLPSGASLEMSSGCYLIEIAGGGRILVDSGMPAAVHTPSAPPAASDRNVLERLAAIHLRPEDIHIVICTHFDIDHCGYHDSFPHAEFIVQREHYLLARGGHPRFTGARAHWDHPGLRYRLVDGDTTLLPGITLLETSGHVAGHQSVLVRLPRTGPVLLAIDAVMMRHTFHIERKAWPNDDNEAQLRASTKKLLELVERESVALVVFGHDGQQWKTLKKSPEYYD
jgi:N-acyl homoserine lactone hydrolase